MEDQSSNFNFQMRRCRKREERKQKQGDHRENVLDLKTRKQKRKQ